MTEIVICKPQQLLRDHNMETISSSNFFVENGWEELFEQKDNYVASEHRKLADLREKPKWLTFAPLSDQGYPAKSQSCVTKSCLTSFMMGNVRRCRRESDQAETEQTLSFIHRPAKPWTTIVWETGITHWALKMKTMLKGLNVTVKLKDKQHLSLQWQQYHVTLNKLCENRFTGSCPKLTPPLIRKHTNIMMWRGKLNPWDWIIFGMKTKRFFKS